ncbi:MAG TPA: zf-TFIIB domain-containing protein, partial [Isosphaeraceae bacterium]|nr:zf-TFIIB domain-containing protein [Isosphaeraceae bacterium]
PMQDDYHQAAHEFSGDLRMDCPRCHLMLRRTDYEGVEVDMCDNCWGIWLDSGEMGAIIDSREMDFSETERQQFLKARANLPAMGPGEPIHCPVCNKPMDVLSSDVGLHIVIDRCVDHGIWLDSGEIKAVQAVAEDSREFYNRLFQKLGLTRENDVE